MTTRLANVKGIAFPDALGDLKTQIAIVTFDLAQTAFTGGSDTITIGGGGYDDGITTTDTLATIISKRKRDGKTYTIYDVMRGPPGYQAAATNGPTIYFQGTIAVSAGNITGITLYSALTSGSAVTTTAAYWDRAGAIYVLFQAA